MSKINVLTVDPNPPVFDLDFEIDSRSFNLIPPVATLPELWRSGSKLVQTCKPSVWEVSNTGNAGANEYLETGENAAGSAVVGEVPLHALAIYKTLVRCFFDGALVAGAGTGAYVGMQLGSVGSAPPYAGSPTKPIIQWRWRLDTGRVELYTAKGNGTASATTASAPNGGGLSAVKIFWEPDVPKCSVYQNGLLLCEQTNPAVLPDFFLAHDSGVGMVAFTGSASSQIRMTVGPIRISYLDSLWQG